MHSYMCIRFDVSNIEAKRWLRNGCRLIADAMSAKQRVMLLAAPVVLVRLGRGPPGRLAAWLAAACQIPVLVLAAASVVGLKMPQS